ncbi:unnamed protein product [Gongylonema pulchrum]|uniref:Kazal-like domain-containing protein n=1 Tax=Gongylonema pulchrum TaxID=637853 RepID=A0A183DF07_9BILA|nr:unnamed protein product [Gongylonema pulchrum]
MPNCKCPRTCSMDYLGLVASMTVCGSDGSTYDNICELQQFACTHQLDLVPRTLGKCPHDGSGDEMQKRRGREMDSAPALGNLCVDDADCLVYNSLCGQLNALRLKSCECRQGFFPSKDLTQCIQGSLECIQQGMDTI